MPNARAEPIHRDDLLQAADALLQPARFKDYGPNGLQVEGKPQVRHLVSGVTASLALIDAAIESGADAILVHHGLFWRGQDGRVTGWMKQRLARLLTHDISLLAYHLPLDAHPDLGNNAQLAQHLGLQVQGAFGEQDLGLWGQGTSTDPQVVLNQIRQQLGREPLCVQPDSQRPWRRIAWCSGGAQGYFEAAIAAGADAFLTGEISEPQAHLARETGVAFLACGHHATERYGAPAVAQHLADELGLSHQFIDIPNPA
ncbi:MAG: Nif3-like dinuclear metal center hexameric protein [Alphaproteobacteria bacterium]|nr:Nif3-like dinuclear metal center hexameric protein [Alphaproteobacteria bacterium]